MSIEQDLFHPFRKEEDIVETINPDEEPVLGIQRMLFSRTKPNSRERDTGQGSPEDWSSPSFAEFLGLVKPQPTEGDR